MVLWRLESLLIDIENESIKRVISWFRVIKSSYKLKLFIDLF